MATTTKTTTAESQAGGSSGDDLKTEQEKAAKAAGAGEKKKLVRLGDTEAEDAPGMGEPYPEGSPPDPDVLFEAVHGFKKSDL